ncbi:5470_t:CDS:1, partial [Ambispora leptoticha]
PVICQADSRLKYINCVFLNRSLQEAKEREPDDIDLIAAICSAKNLDEEIFKMLLLFRQVREALLAVKDNISDKVLQNWREKAMITKLNSGSIDYLANMSLKEITREKNKMEIIKESPDIFLIEKKSNTEKK